MSDDGEGPVGVEMTPVRITGASANDGEPLAADIEAGHSEVSRLTQEFLASARDDLPADS
jgi:hypothetical protein